MINIRRSGEQLQQGSSIFLEMKLLKLQVSDEDLKAVRIVVYKGLQKLDQTAVFDIKNNSDFVIDESILNFPIRNFQKKKNITFKIVLQTAQEPSNQIGSFDIQANNFILPFIKDGVNTFTRIDSLNSKVELEYMLFVDRTRTQVERSMRSFQESKNSTKNIELVNEWTITSPAMSQKQSLRKLHNKVQHSDQVANHNITPHSKKFNKPGVFLTASQNQNISKASNQQLSHRSNKIWFEMEDGQEIVNNLIPRRRQSSNKNTQIESVATGVKVVGGLAILGIIAYLMVLLDNMNYGMDVVRGVIEAEIRQNYL